MECDKLPLVLEGELQEPTLAEKNVLAIDKEWLLEEKQENVLVGVEDFYFPIESLTFNMEMTNKFHL